jgi:hypothetical protein
MPMANEQIDQVGWVDPVADMRLLQRVRSEFLEMPGLSVTFWQAMRLWNLEEHVCRAVLDLLVQGGFLLETRHGAFRRVGG